MPTLSDARFEALRGLGFTGATSDMLREWLISEGGAATQPTFAFNGVDQYATMTAWNPTTHTYKMSARTNNNVVTDNQHVFASTGDGLTMLLAGVTQFLRQQYVDTTAALRSVTASTSPPTPGVEYFTEGTYTALDASITTSPDIGAFTNTNAPSATGGAGVAFIGASDFLGANTFFNGTIRDLRLIDPDPLNTRIYPMNEGSGNVFKCYDGTGAPRSEFDATIQNYTDNWVAPAAGMSIPDLWRAFLDAKGFSTGQRNDDWYAYLGSLGYTGSLNDRELAFWLAQAPSGGPTPPPIGEAPLPDTSLTAGDLPGDRVGYQEDGNGSLAPNEGAEARVTQLYTRPIGSGRLYLYAENKLTGDNLPPDVFSSMRLAGRTFLASEAEYTGDRWRWSETGLALQEGQTYPINFTFD